MKSYLFSVVFSLSTFCYGFDASIPLIHLPDFFDPDQKQNVLEQVESAARDVGFFAITGTGVDSKLLDECYDEIAAYFHQSLETKLEQQSRDGQRGYVPGESAKGESRVDFKEFYHVGREMGEEDLARLGYPANVWPNHSEKFRTAMRTLYSALDQCKDVIGYMLSSSMEQRGDFLKEMIDEGNSLMRAIHYPANPPKDAIWAGAHTDINLFTILPRSTARGLQVLNSEGEFIDVIVPDGAFVINCGDMLENLTNGYFKSAVHRVIDSQSNQERYSVVFFVHPRPNDLLDPLANFIEKTGGVRKYANITAMELLGERLIDLGLASPDLMSFFVDSGAVERLKEVHRFSPKAEMILKEKGFDL